MQLWCNCDCNCAQEAIDLRKDRQALQRLTEAAEKAKIELSSLSQTNINLPFITATADGPKHIDLMLSRAKFEEMCGDLLERCRKPVEQVGALVPPVLNGSTS
jgi:molecular chaperone DnaK